MEAEAVVGVAGPAPHRPASPTPVGQIDVNQALRQLLRQVAEAPEWKTGFPLLMTGVPNGDSR